jgi:endonuclease/exonuclease/phosphatase (EEP) superfamily protein YafD
MKARPRPRSSAIVLAAALGLAACARPAAPPPPPLPPGAAQVRVLTYNVNYGLAGDPATLAAFRDAGADLVLLQETTTAWERVLRGALSAQYPHMVFRHHGGAGGQGMLSRLPVRTVEFYPPAGDGWFPAGASSSKPTSARCRR